MNHKKLKLNQVVALESGYKTNTHTKITELHHRTKQTDLFNGMIGEYRPKDEGGDNFPKEAKLVQASVEDVWAQATEEWTSLCDVILTKERGNCLAKADIKIGDKVLVADVPVAYLIQMGKVLNDVETFVKNLPTLDPAETWTLNTDQGLYESDPIETAKQHQAVEFLVIEKSGVPEKGVPNQIREVTKNTVAGYWTRKKLSATIPPTKKEHMLDRVRALQDAVKIAKEEANQVEIEMSQTMDQVFAFITG